MKTIIIVVDKGCAPDLPPRMDLPHQLEAPSAESLQLSAPSGIAQVQRATSPKVTTLWDGLHPKAAKGGSIGTWSFCPIAGWPGPAILDPDVSLGNHRAASQLHFSFCPNPASFPFGHKYRSQEDPRENILHTNSGLVPNLQQWWNH